MSVKEERESRKIESIYSFKRAISYNIFRAQDFIWRLRNGQIEPYYHPSAWADVTEAIFYNAERLGRR